MAPANNGKPPGFFGVLKITARVLSHSSKHFLHLSAFLLLIPFALFAPTQPNKNPTFADLLAKISALGNSTPSSEYNLNPSDAVAGQQPRPYLQTLPFVLSLGFALFIITVTTPALTVSVCTAYLNKDLSIKSSLRAIPQSFFRNLLTFVCLIAAFIGVFLIVSVSAGIVGALIMSLLRTRAGIVGALIMSLLRTRDRTLVIVHARTLVIVLASVLGIWIILYFVVLWRLASTVTILEQKWGWEAMSRSAYLMKGRKRVGLCLTVFFRLCYIFVPIFLSEEAPMLARLSVAAVSIVIWCLLALNDMTSTVILYISCKEFHNETTEMLPLTTKSTLEHTSFTYTEMKASLSADMLEPRQFSWTAIPLQCNKW